MDNKIKLEFHGGSWMSLVPFAVFLIGTVYISIMGAPTETGMVLFALIGILLGVFFAKDRWQYSEEIFNGMANPIAVVPVLCWLISGFFGAILKSSGLVGGLVWVASKLNLNGAMFCVAAFLICSIYASATGTSMGTIIPCMAVIYPAGVIIGANPVVLAGAIVSGGCFGDNIAPISDTTITSAKINNVAIGDVVRSRLKYAAVTAIAAIIAFLIFGNGTPVTGVDGVNIMKDFSDPKTLPMILPAVLVIFLAIRGRHLVESIAWGSVFAIVLALALKLLTPSQLIAIKDGAPVGILIDGVSGMFGLCILAVLLAPMAHLFAISGLLSKIRKYLIDKLITSKRKAEVSVLIIMGIFDALINFSTVAMLAAGPSLIKEIGKKYDIDGVRLANLMDCSACTVSYLLPYMVPLVAVMTVSGEVALQYTDIVPQLTSTEVIFTSFYPLFMIGTVLVATLTGWGSKTDLGKVHSKN
ncbi:Na+/H+ antiporter NhaC family protein [Miniphocaeibacter massiliensis]|uniref:Na+/H+ antiporter NhaC family protein n=1 Tax=Miniphocaeibacter massiliensis TaxID=2041841 RepID=UPI000C1C03C4|nr:Na+/H+ antiporter NhaC family protein [Miniphocaeibacter massiliensis]